MDMLTNILDIYIDQGFKKVDGFDAAVIGVSSTGCIVYSTDMIIKILMSRNNWLFKDALDYFYYSIEDTHKGDKAPIFVNLIKD